MPGLAVAVEAEPLSQRPLFGGCISCSFPTRFQDMSNLRMVPDNQSFLLQEVFLDPNRDESIIVELLELKDDVSDDSSASWFLEDLAFEQDAKEDLVVETRRNLSASDLPLMDPSMVMNLAVGTLAFSEVREGLETTNSVRVYLANIRMRNVQTDLLITFYEPLVISSDAGRTGSAVQAGCMTVADVFNLILRTFKIEDWGLFR